MKYENDMSKGEMVVFFIVVGVVLLIIFKTLASMNEKVKQDAIQRCGSESNLVEHIDNDGTTWYSCKVEK